MRHADVAAALALLFATASNVQAVPASGNADFRASVQAQAGQQKVSNNSSPAAFPLQQDQGPEPAGSQQQQGSEGQELGLGQSAGGAAGLLALPGAQVTTGQLQAFPGVAATESSAAAVETSSVALGEVVSEVSIYLFY
jgi:hypothetical protein